MPFHWFQPRPPARPALTAVFVLGGTFLCLAIIFVVATLLNSVLPPELLLYLGVACVVLALVQALISGIFISQWKPCSEQTVSFYVTFTLGFLLLVWVSLGSALLMFNPELPTFSVVNAAVPFGIALGIFLSLPYVIVQFRQRRRVKQTPQEETTSEG